MRIGSLCSGYGGLDMAVEEAFGATTAWVSDIDKGACKILAHRYPDVPNIGDMTTVDWAALEPVDIVTAGYPCQPFSHAGRRKGTNDDRHLWPYVREAVRVLRPRLTVLENVAGHRSLGFDRVLGDLAEDGLHVRWTSLRAADIGAPHGRERLFIVVTPDAEHPQLERDRRGGVVPTPARQRVRHVPAEVPAVARLLPTPRATDGTKGGPNQRGSSGDRMLPSAVMLLPTPEASRAGGTPERHVERKPGRTVCTNLDVLASGSSTNWGDYAAAIARWEHVLGRPAPAPTMTSAKGNPQLSPAFVEWMMGLPAGWVTDVPGVTRNEALKALGNGVVSQQATAALRTMLAWEAVA